MDTPSRVKLASGPRKEETTTERLQLVAVLLLAFALISATAAVAQTSQDRILEEGASSAPAEIPPPNVDDPVSEAELQDLRTIADQSGISLQAAIDRYAWNDNFALAVAGVREAFPKDFAGAEIVDADHAWIGFAARPPESAREVIDAFGKAHGVTVDVRPNLGFNELDLRAAIEAAHFAVLGTAGVSNALTTHDLATGQIAITVVLEDAAPQSVIDGLRPVALRSIADSAGADILNHIMVSVTRSASKVVGGTESNSEHLGGEALSTCTSGFGTETSSGVRGIATAGHCGNSQSDDGFALTFKDDYEGTHGDFQWHTGPKPERDDSYSGNSSSTEVNLRDVSSVGSPVVGQSLCRNGKTSHKDCQEVRKLNVCSGSVCNLVEMGAHLSAGGDSGAPVFWGNTAYGIHRGWIYDPFWPFDREVFSRADRIDNAFGIFIATS